MIDKKKLRVNDILLDKEKEEFLKNKFIPDVKEAEIKPGDKKTIISRNEFFQIPPYWLMNPERGLYPVVWTETNRVSHPIRHNPERGTLLYKRFVYEIDKTISFRVIDPKNDIDTFSRWHNQPRISEFWELKDTRENHLQYIEKNLNDPHIIPVILDINDEPTGYFELYWVKEDRLGAYYESGDFDRGFHFLIGEKKFLGLKNTGAMLKSVIHYLFLDEPRTLKIMAEPRSDNKKVLKYVDFLPFWKRIKEFDFPHKRAVLLECTRERFFTGGYL
ncbi:GNAT family N-acetyltransferase [Nitrosococcus oceani]|uniref:Aerobactin siderophore biosynthesis protein IucB n=2 Tax=Nitrosococcus oceani TaxID=1229 RepID=Q3JA63_NITOC|nr:GNAT family N-acetyltransferase [Nitrosococcus oceani]KFI19210.1 aerobactin siderophore biosynthesis protein iucB [Nitrosococcus oceani C-27]ABA58283.1 Aerobactin siderophore biosynthesis protein IucB [Nitrosococcus oceani ATCC 19707]EDZ68489.1 hypothetical protein NOC27_1816 [Nitrosococcus oceani AFC27]KFI22474.1 aerobactin siderophore biosynthesis protein iucB [Nitrosococcus oceani]GEM18664.1 acetyltransferase [Nitrosococcus oceani]